MSKNKSHVESPSDPENPLEEQLVKMEIDQHKVTNSRVFAASREVVFAAFSDPQQLAQWWGPKGFTNTFQEFDLRPGGQWHFVMHGPDGTDYPNRKSFVQVVTPERIVFDHPDPAHRFRMTMTFVEQDRKTQLTWCMRFESADEFSKLKNFIAEANEQNLDRLEAHLAKVV